MNFLSLAFKLSHGAKLVTEKISNLLVTNDRKIVFDKGSRTRDHKVGRIQLIKQRKVKRPMS